MRKLKLFSLALMAFLTTNVWAADPDISFEIPVSGASKLDYFKEWSVGTSKVTLSSTMDLSSNDSHQNISISSNAGNLTSNYISIKVTTGSETIDSISVYAGGSGNNKGIKAPAIGWTTGYAEQTTTANALDYFEFTSASSGGGKIGNANWYVVDFSGDEIKEVRIYKKLSKNQVTIEGEDTSNDLGSGETIRIWGMKIWLKAGKTPVDTTATLTAVKVNDVAISASDFATLLEDPFKVDLSDSYVTAPTMKFARHTVITYDDSSTKITDDTITVAATEVSSKWQAQATINSTTYTVTAVIPSTYKVAYYDGASKLGDELVEVGEHPTAVGVDTDKEFYSFQAWQKDAVDIALTAVEGAAGDSITLVARYTKVYSQSINIEQTVLDYGTGYDIETAFATKGISYVDIDALDTLNDLEKKDNRNYAFLGLKIKKTTSKVSVLLAAGSTLRVKFGNVGAKITVKVGNADPVDKTADNLKTPYEYTNDTEGDIIVRFNSTDTKTVVFKQIMIDDPIEEVELPAPGAYAITLAETTNGSITASWEGKTDKKVNVPVSATVTLTVTPDDGYKVASVKYNDGEDHVIEPVESVYSFTMPAAAVTVSATFSVATALDNTEDAVKAVKRLENGMLVIEKNGVRYNAQGQIIR